MTSKAQEFDKIEKEFLDYLRKIFDDINDSIEILRKTKSSLIKSELCLVFIGADTFSRFYKILQGAKEEELDQEIGNRFKAWFNKFVFTEKNKIYQEHKEEIRCDAVLVWKLRNALVHFYGLPDSQKTGGQIGFSGGDLKLIRDREKKFREWGGYHIKLLQPYLLIKAILHGFFVQLQFMMEMIKQNPAQYINGVLLAHRIIIREGGSVVVRDKK